jgi:hypothetical protein
LKQLLAWYGVHTRRVHVVWNTSLVRKVERDLSPKSSRGHGCISASKEVLRCTWLLLL